MDLSLEAYRNIVKNIRSRADIANLCTVSRGFQYVAERALYNTLYMQDIRTTMMLCDTLSRQPRVSALVDALTISVLDVSDNDEEEDSEGEEEEEGEEEDDEETNRELATALQLSLRSISGVEEEEGDTPLSSRPGGSAGYDTPRAGGLPSEYWNLISNALRRTNRLRHLNIHVNSNFDTSTAWILEGCTFRLRSFHCDLNWDEHLVAFLNSQIDLDDLYIIDYNEHDSETPRPQATPIGSRSSPSPDTTHSFDTTTQLDTQSLPNLSTLECTFSEAAVALIPGRPIVRLKTCFSRSDITEKRAEMNLLFSKIRQSTRELLSLDIADSSYSDEFSMELLRTVVSTLPTSTELRYLGTLVLPIAGSERLMFYALLMRLHRLSCIELEVSEWDPSPLVGGAPAFRALANELRLYCPTVTRVVFVHDFERTVVSYVQGVAKIDVDISPEILWRDV